MTVNLKCVTAVAQDGNCHRQDKDYREQPRKLLTGQARIPREQLCQTDACTVYGAESGEEPRSVVHHHRFGAPAFCPRLVIHVQHPGFQCPDIVKHVPET